MLSIVILKDSGAIVNYFNKENYYTDKDAEEALENSGWFGKGAGFLKLQGQTVSKETFQDLLDGKIDGIKLGKRSKDKQSWEHTPGWDLTFSAPKSYSILNQISDNKDLHEVHNKAVNETLSFLQDHVSTVRLTKDGITKKEIIGNLLVAKFRHDTSRALDPNDHTHCVVLNAVKTENGWRSLDSKKIFDMKMEAGEFYRRCLAREIERLGYKIDITREKDFLFEIKGVPKELIAHHSKRRKEILNYLDEVGLDSAKAASIASLETRPKKLDPDRAELKEEWKGIAKDYNFNPEGFNREASNHKQTPSNDKQKKIEAFDHVVKFLSERDASFTSETLVRECQKNKLYELSYYEIKEIISEKLKTKELIAIGDTQQEIYTTQAGQAMEKSAVDMLYQGYRSVPSINENVDFKELFPDIEFSKGQHDSLKLILETNDQFIGVQGYAGTGKTFMLNAAATIAELKGYTIKGMAPSSSAAQVLGEDLCRPTQNTSQHIADFFKLKNQNKNKPIDKTKELWFIDESSLASTSLVKQLMEIATETGARVVFIGDIAQKDSVEAGRIFAQLQKAGMDTAVMADIKRQKKQELREAVYSMVSLIGVNELREIEKNLDRDIDAARDEFRVFCDNVKPLVSEEQHKRLLDISRQLFLAEGKKERNNCLHQAISLLADDVTRALDKIQGNIHSVEGNDERNEALVNSYMDLSPEDREKTILVIPANEGRDEINELLRDEFKKENRLTGETLQLKALVNRGLHAEKRRYTYSYKKGDVVRFGENDRKYKIGAGEYYRVKANHGEEKGIELERIGAGGKSPKNVLWKPNKNMRSRKVEIYKENARPLQVGDKIRWRKNQKDENIVNGDEITVTGIKGMVINTVNSQGEKREFDLSHMKYRHMDYAYTHTVDTAQGATYKNVISLCESYRRNLINQKAFYVVLSRAEFNATIFTEKEDKLIKAIMERHGANTVAMDVKGYLAKKEQGIKQEESTKNIKPQTFDFF